MWQNCVLQRKQTEDAKNVEKIKKALEEVAALSSDPSKPDAPTFGKLIEEGKLPGGPVK